MEQRILWDLHCFQCSLQFDKKSLYDLHLSIIHNYKSRPKPTVKSEPEEIEFPIDLDNIESNYQGNQKSIDNLHDGRGPFKCETCDKNFLKKVYLKKHFASIHEGKKPFKCETCDYMCSQKDNLNGHLLKKET